MSHTCVTLDDKGAFGRQKTETTIHIIAGLRERAVSGPRGAHGEHMRKISIKSNINSQPRSTEEAHIPANRTVSGRSRTHALLRYVRTQPRTLSPEGRSAYRGFELFQ